VLFQISSKLGVKGGFQAVKLQRPARATVCSHSERDMAATLRRDPNTIITMLVAGVYTV